MITSEKNICPRCGVTVNRNTLDSIFYICKNCDYHYRMKPQARIAYMADHGSFIEFSGNLRSLNPLEFEGYEQKISSAESNTQMNEAIITGKCTIEGKPLILGVMSFEFMGGSMGSVVGEKISRAFLKGAKEKTPVLIYAASGGARMQEGVISLMQMVKTSSAAAELSKAGVPYFVILNDPVTGGVNASFASLADIVMAEPGALIGFAGPRVIEAIIGQKLPEGFQRAEYQMGKGLIDIIVHRSEQRKIISLLLDLHSVNNALPIPSSPAVKLPVPEGSSHLKECSFSNENPEYAWKKVLLARHPQRPYAIDYINKIFDNFIELHGDRTFRDDPAIIGGIAFIDSRPVTILANQKGRTLNDNVFRNFGMANPEGYRKALRLAKEAEKFKRPVITFIDTPGAYPGIGAEERGIGEAIARNIQAFTQLLTPVICIIIGEGGSGGALAFGVGDKVYMLENSIYSVISPEGCASILFKDSSKTKDAATMLKITSDNILNLKIIDGIIPEPPESAHTDPDMAAAAIKKILISDLNELTNTDVETLVRNRNKKFRDIGFWSETALINDENGI